MMNKKICHRLKFTHQSSDIENKGKFIKVIVRAGLTRTLKNWRKKAASTQALREKNLLPKLLFLLNNMN